MTDPNYDPNYLIFPKMRIADIIETVDGSGYYKRRNNILPKHVDFVICNALLEPVLAIELDGGYHNKPSMVKRDKFIDELFEGVRLPLKRIKVGDNFKAVAVDIRERLKD